MKAMKLIAKIVLRLSALMTLTAFAASSSGPWEQPCAALAEQIGGIVGPGQAQLTIRNLSTISPEEIPAIHKLLEEDLRARGVVSSGVESANSIRVTLSESARERLWVAEVMEGNQTQVTMVKLNLDSPHQRQAIGGMLLRREVIFTMRDQPLAVLLVQGELVALDSEEIAIFDRASDGWREIKRVRIGQERPLPRDPRGILIADAGGTGFHAWLAGVQCAGSSASSDWALSCHASDDPWPIFQVDNAVGLPPISAFYNAARNYFTGVVTPNLGVDPPPFYSATVIPRPAGVAAMLVNGIDGKVLLADNDGLKSISGTRDWGSDFAVIHSGCGAGTEVIASGSGEAATDSLRVYELPALEAVPASAPITMDGTVTALWTAPDGKSAFAVVRAGPIQYEVNRVSALCN
jgi:hypothetical protein